MKRRFRTRSTSLAAPASPRRTARTPSPASRACRPPPHAAVDRPRRPTPDPRPLQPHRDPRRVRSESRRKGCRLAERCLRGEERESRALRLHSRQEQRRLLSHDPLPRLRHQPHTDPLGEPGEHASRQPDRTPLSKPGKRRPSILLFSRLRADDRAFWFLGPATYRGHVGERPMAITWELPIRFRATVRGLRRCRRLNRQTGRRPFACRTSVPLWQGTFGAVGPARSADC